MPEKPVIDELLTVVEVAEILKVSPRTVQRHIFAGKLQSKRIGRFHRVKVKDLEAFIEGEHSAY